MQPENLASADIAKLAILVRRFNASFEAQQKRDSETIAGLVRVLRNPRSDAARADVDAFREIVKQLIREDSHMLAMRQ
jgi:hypothetical protein